MKNVGEHDLVEDEASRRSAAKKGVSEVSLRARETTIFHCGSSPLKD